MSDEWTSVSQRWPVGSVRFSSRSSARCTSRPSATPTTQALGFDPSPRHANGVALPDGPAYFTSRGSRDGPGAGRGRRRRVRRVQPRVVVPLRELGWTLTDAATICAARDDGAVAQLRRILGDEPDGVDRAPRAV